MASDLKKSNKNNNFHKTKRGMRQNNNPTHLEAAKNLLAEAKNIDFAQKEFAQTTTCENSKRKLSDNLKSLPTQLSHTSNIFYVLARTSDWDERKSEAFINWLPKDYHEYLERVNMLGIGTLYIALTKENYVFVSTVVSRLINLGRVLEVTCGNGAGNALHMVIIHDYPDIETLVERCKNHPEIFTNENNKRDLPLHMAMDVEADTDDLKRILRKHFSMAIFDTINSTGIQSESLILPLEIVKLLIAACPDALKHRNKEGKTPYQIREEILSTDEAVLIEVQKLDKARIPVNSKSPLHWIFAEDPIASYIKSHCVRHFFRDKIMRCLYKPSKGRFSKTLSPTP